MPNDGLQPLSQNSQALGQTLQDIVSMVTLGNAKLASDIGEVKSTTTDGLSRVQGQLVQIQESVAQTQLGSLANASAKSGGLASGLIGSLFLSPLWKGLASLFGGGSEPKTVQLTPFQQPQSANFDLPAANLGGSTASSTVAPATPKTPAANANNVNITINAMDARSILDRSDEIAAAVRVAILSGNNVSESVNEL